MRKFGVVLVDLKGNSGNMRETGCIFERKKRFNGTYNALNLLVLCLFPLKALFPVPPPSKLPLQACYLHPPPTKAIQTTSLPVCLWAETRISCNSSLYACSVAHSFDITNPYLHASYVFLALGRSLARRFESRRGREGK